MEHALPETVHATCLVVGWRGLLIRGTSGSGKSALALALLAGAPTVHAALISDDRVKLQAANGRLIASAPETIRGLIEVRGAGPVEIPRTLPHSIISTVVDLLPEMDVPRLPETGDDVAKIGAIRLPRLMLPAGPEHIAPNAVTVRTLLALQDSRGRTDATSISR